MDHAKFLILLTILVIFYRPVNAATYDAVDYRAFAQDSNGNWKTIRGSGGNFTIQSGNGGNTVTQTGKLPIPASNGKSYPVSVPRTAAVDMLKVGGALANMAKKLTPAGMAIGTVAFICTETNICDLDGSWQFNETSNIPTEDSTGWCAGGNLTFKQCVEQSGSCGYEYVGGQLNRRCSDPQQVSPTSFNLKVYSSSGSLLFYITVTRTSTWTPTGQPRPVTDTDWDNAADQLNQPASTDHIINNGGDVPVDVSTPPTIDNAPINQPIGTSTSTNYDNLGNATGTTVTESTLQITDGATAQAPNSITYNETTIINNYDLNNNLVDSTTTTTDTPPPAPPEATDVDYEIKFDDVSDNDLEEYEFPAVFSQDSWGTGSCPADRSVSYSHGSLDLTYQPVCEFAEGIKPAVLVIAGLAAMFIVSGVRTE